MYEQIYKTIIEHELINMGENVIVGISGGPDSVCLLHALVSISDRLGVKVYAAHVNHMLRGSESDQDQQYVLQLCERIGVKLFAKSFDIKGMSTKLKLSLEEAGREARYSFFEEISRELGNAKIAVAHNKNDQAETVLMHIFRGTGLEGLKGMDYKRGEIIRPLLDIERSEIESYCVQHMLNPRIDSSNKHTVYTRNKVRLELIPHVQKLLGVDLIKAVTRMTSLLREDSEFINMLAVESYKTCRKDTCEGQIGLDITKLVDFHRALRSRVIRLALSEVKGNLKGIESVHIDDVERLAIEGRTGAVAQLPGGLRAARSYGILNIYKEENEKNIYNFDIRIVIPGKTHIMELESYIEATIVKKSSLNILYRNIKQDSMEQFFDYDCLSKGINIRRRRNGDIFWPCGSKGSKKLKEYFIDRKVPREVRNNMLLVAEDSDIVWIIGQKINDKFKVTENTTNVLKLKYIKNNIKYC